MQRFEPGQLPLVTSHLALMVFIVDLLQLFAVFSSIFGRYRSDPLPIGSVRSAAETP